MVTNNAEELQAFPDEWETTIKDGREIYVLTNEQKKKLWKDISSLIPADEREAMDRMIVSASSMVKLENDEPGRLPYDKVIAFTRLTQEDRVNIRLAANCDDEELFKLVTETVFRLMLRLIMKEASRLYNGDYTQMGDLINEAYCSIRKNIRAYDGVHALSTFFKTWIVSEMLRERFDMSAAPLGRTQKNAKIKIKIAMDALKEIGNEEPTVQEVRDMIMKQRKYTLPYKTVARLMNSDNMVTSLNEFTDGHLEHPAMPSPEDAYMEQESQDERIEAFNRLPEKYRRALRLFWWMMDRPQVKNFKNSDYVALYREYIDPDIRPDVALRYLNEGKRKLRKFYGHIADYDDTEMTSLRLDDSAINEESENIFSALEDEGMLREVFSVDMGEDMFIGDFD